MNELLDKISQLNNNEIVTLIDKFVQDNKNTVVDIGILYRRYYILGDDYIINVLYIYPSKPIIAILAIKDRFLNIRVSSNTIKYYRLNSGLDKLKNRLHKYPYLAVNIDEIDAEKVFGVDVSWVTKRVSTKSACF